MAASLGLLSRAAGPLGYSKSPYRTFRHGKILRQILSPAAARSYRAVLPLSFPTGCASNCGEARVPSHNITARRWFESEAAYHPIADETLESIQDAIDEALDSTTVEYEVNLASGVLTFDMPPHGTWVLNKQTPNRQIWWSSPLSGPRRFEYDETDGLWFSTKDGLNLGRSLVQEIHHVYPQVEEFELNV